MAKSPADYARFGLRRAEDFATAWSLDSDDARHFSQGASINTDDRNQLATRSSGLGKKALHAEGGSRLMLPYNPLRSKGAPLDRIYMVRRLASQNRSERARQLAESGSDPVERLTALGWAMSRISPQRAFADFQRALARDPTSQSARFGLMRVRRRAVETRDPEYLRLADPLEGAAAAVVAGWRHVAEGDFRALSALDSELLAADPLDPSYDDALRLRIRWRAESEDPALRAQATEIAREILSANPVAEDAVVAARAFAASERPVAALQVLDFLSHSPRTPNFERAGLEILDALPAEVDPAHRDAVRSRLTRPASAP